MLYDFGHDASACDSSGKTREAVRAEQSAATCRRTAAWATHLRRGQGLAGRRWPAAASQPGQQ